MSRAGVSVCGNNAALTKTDGALALPSRALIVARKDHRTSKTRQLLEDKHVSSYVADPDSDDVFALLERDARVSVLLIRVSELSRARLDELLRLAFDRPGLRIFATGATGTAATTLRKRGATLLRAIEGPQQVAKRVVESLAGHHFDLAAVEMLSETLPHALTDTGIEVEALPSLVRVGATALAELSAIVAFAGDSISGRIVVFGCETFFGRVSREWLGNNPTTKEWIWDAAGELCNRVAGDVRKHYRMRGLSSRQSTPTIIDGHRVSIRSTPVSPGLIAPFQCSRIADPVHVELVLTSKQPDQEPVVEDDSMVAGELTFL